MSLHRTTSRLRPAVFAAPSEAASAYNDAGEGYLAYADGDGQHIYSFDGHLADCDRRVWKLLDAQLQTRRKAGATSISILDAGCGPGTWLRRIVSCARWLGFDTIKARGFDVADKQVALARKLSADLSRVPGIALTFEVGDVSKPLSEADASVDLCLCLYGVLNHLPVAAVTAALDEFARVTRGEFVATVRAAGSLPTVFVALLDRASEFRQDNVADRCVVALKDGRQIALDFHLYTAVELRTLMEGRFAVAELMGLDLFHSRFATDRRWNPPSAEGDGHFERELDRLEMQYARNPHFIDRAAHLLVVGRPTSASAAEEKTGRVPVSTACGVLHPCLPRRTSGIW